MNLKPDLEHIAEHINGCLGDLSGRRVFLTGATGFFGTWLLETVAWLNDNVASGIQVLALTRNQSAFASKMPHLANRSDIIFIEGDIQTFEFPAANFDYVIHGATTNARETWQGEDALSKFDTVAAGTRHLMDFCRQISPKTLRNVLYLGSGACYGPQPAAMLHIDETFTGAPDPEHSASALGLGKRAAEFYCHYYHQQFDVPVTIARCFSFYGPHLPLDIHYAVGNFVRDGLAGKPIVVNGDGTPERSFLYIADCIIWLLTMLVRGEAGKAYNVGSEQTATIRVIAETIGGIFGVPVQIVVAATRDSPVNRYVPSTFLARSTLGLEEWIDFETGINRMAEHVRATPGAYST